MGVRKYPQVKPNDCFERLTVVARSDKAAVYPHFYWECVCDCGNTKTVADNKLKQGEIRSCGCLRRETCSATGKTNRTHGEAVHGQETPEFSAWSSMIHRTSHPENPALKNWAGRGIKTCEGYRASYETFLADIGRRPSDSHSLDRSENEGHYSCGKCPECLLSGWPFNVRWATPEQQHRNKRTNKLLTINGETKCQVEWAPILNLTRSSLSSRLRRKWSLERIMSQPMRLRSTT